MLRKCFNLIFVAVLMNSCIPYRYIDIQYYDKPRQSLPVNSGNVLVVASLYNRDIFNKKEMMEWALDSVAAVEAAASLGQIIPSSPLYSGITTLNTILYRSDTSRVILPLTWDEVTALSQKNDSAGIIISVDYMHVTPHSECIPRWAGSVLEYYGYLDINIYCCWRVYDLNNRKVSNLFLHQDTLTWEATDWVEVRAGNQLPGFFTASAYAGADAAEKYSAIVAPSWKSDTRIIFNSGSELFAQAEKFAKQGRWLEAASIWQKLTRNASASIASKAAFNMALANEMLGNFELALEWLTEAEKRNPSLNEIYDYKGVIESRIEANR